MDERLANLLDETITGMRDFAVEADVSYRDNDIEECRSIMAEHASSMHTAKDAAAARRFTKSTVEKLNRLNERPQFELIEADQRETICAFIIRAGFLRGFNAVDEDATEEWSEW